MKKDLKAFTKLRSDLIIKSIESISLSGYEPHITCFTDAISGLPEHLYSEKFIVLDVSAQAVGNFVIFDDCIEVQLKFSGVNTTLIVQLLGVINVSGVENNVSVITYIPNNGFVVSKDLTKSFIELCENGGKLQESVNDTNKSQPIKRKHLTVVK